MWSFLFAVYGESERLTGQNSLKIPSPGVSVNRLPIFPTKVTKRGVFGDGIAQKKENYKGGKSRLLPPFPSIKIFTNIKMNK